MPEVRKVAPSKKTQDTLKSTVLEAIEPQGPFTSFEDEFGSGSFSQNTSDQLSELSPLGNTYVDDIKHLNNAVENANVSPPIRAK